MSKREVLEVLKENPLNYYTGVEIMILLKDKGITVNYNSISTNLKKLKKDEFILYKINPDFNNSLRYKYKEVSQ